MCSSLVTADYTPKAATVREAPPHPQTCPPCAAATTCPPCIAPPPCAVPLPCVAVTPTAGAAEAVSDCPALYYNEPDNSNPLWTYFRSYQQGPIVSLPPLSVLFRPSTRPIFIALICCTLFTALPCITCSPVLKHSWPSVQIHKWLPYLSVYHRCVRTPWLLSP